MATEEEPFIRGVSVPVFLPGMKWNSTREMIEEILDDLTVPWVQDYILRSHARSDVHALSDPMKYSRSMSGVLDCATIPAESGGFISSVCTVRLDIPVSSFGHIGVGISVEESNQRDTEQFIFLTGLQFSRFVCNNRKNSQLLIRFLDDTRKVTLSYSIYSEDGVWYYVNLHVDATMFLNAFEKNTYAVDFHMINRSITQSLVTRNPYHRKPAVAANHLYPNKVADVVGDHFLRSIVSIHSNGRPVKALPVFAHVRYALNYNARDLRKMQNWAITDRLQHLPPTLIPNPKMSVTGFLLNEDREPHRSTTMSLNRPGQAASSIHAENIYAPQYQYQDRAANYMTNNSNMNRKRVVSIAPRPQALHVQVRDISRPEKDQDEEEAKKLPRKIRKREAAARSYQRKLAKSQSNSSKT